MGAGDLEIIHKLFQFTPLREGRPATCRGLPKAFVFQFTPLREGRQRHIGYKS